MLPIPPALKMWLTVIIIAVLAGLSKLQQDQPAWTWIGFVVAVLGIIENAITIPNGAQQKAQELSDRVNKLTERLAGGGKTLVALMFIGALGVISTTVTGCSRGVREVIDAVIQQSTTPSQAGCAKGIPVVSPVASCVASVVADAMQGMSIPEILKAAGPECVKDAEEVIAILFGSAGEHPELMSTPAFIEAKARRAQAPPGADR